jgi:hypothetical protein
VASDTLFELRRRTFDTPHFRGIEFIEVEGGFRVQKRLAGSPFTRYRGYLRHLKGQDSDGVVEIMRGR